MVLIDDCESKLFFTIEEILIVGIMFFDIYLKGFSVAINWSCAFSLIKI